MPRHVITGAGTWSGAVVLGAALAMAGCSGSVDAAQETTGPATATARPTSVASRAKRVRPTPPLPGLSRRDARRIRGFPNWQRLLRPPSPRLGRLGSAHPGAKRIYVNRTRRRLAPAGRQRFPYPVGTTIVKTASTGRVITLIALMRKVARSGPRDGGWDLVEYQRPAAGVPYRVVGGGEGVCTSCHTLAATDQRTDWVFFRLR